MDISHGVLTQIDIINSLNTLFLATLAYSLIVFSIGNIWETKENAIQKRIEKIKDDNNLTGKQKDKLISQIRLLDIDKYQQMPKNFFHCIILSFIGLFLSLLYTFSPISELIIINALLTPIILYKLAHNTLILRAVFNLPDKIDKEIKKYSDLFYAIDSEDYDSILDMGRD